jgi:hypothetical protein
MPIMTDGPALEPLNKGIDEFHVGRMDSLGAAVSEAFADNPTVQMSGMQQLDRAAGNEIDFGEIATGFPTAGLAEQNRIAAAAPRLDTMLANDMVKKAGLAPHLKLPDQPDIPQAQLEIMMARATARREREATMERGPGGVVQGTLEVGTSFLVGAVDPLNLASAFIPVMGELRYAKLLAGAGEGMAARAGVRAAVGAAEGAVGAAVIEPIDWMAHTQDGRDFGMADVLHNIMFGAVLGSTLHAGGGTLSDIYRARKERPMYPYDLGEPMEAHTPWDDLRTRQQPPPLPRDVLGEYPGNHDPIFPEDPGASRVTPALLSEEIAASQPLVPSPAVQIIDDLPQRAREDAARIGIANLIEGEPLRVGEVLEAAAKTDPRIAESFENVRRGQDRPPPTSPDPLDLAFAGELTAGRARRIADDIRRQTQEVEQKIFGDRAEEWRKLHKRSDRAWDNARDNEARELDAKIDQLERDVGLTEADENWLNGQGWGHYAVEEDWADLARALQDIENGREDAIAASASAVRYLPKSNVWDKMNNRERESVLTILSAMNEEKRAGRDPNAFLRDTFKERINRYGGGADAHEVAEYQMRELAELLDKPLERAASTAVPEARTVAPTARILPFEAPRGQQAGVAAAVDKDAAWRALSHDTPEFDEPAVIAASNAAAEVKPPPTKLDERLTAAEKADAYAKQMYDMFAERLPEQDRLRLDDLIKTIDSDHEARSIAIERGAACLFGARE